jgi:hypothetical protein
VRTIWVRLDRERALISPSQRLITNHAYLQIHSSARLTLLVAAAVLLAKDDLSMIVAATQCNVSAKGLCASALLKTFCSRRGLLAFWWVPVCPAARGATAYFKRTSQFLSYLADALSSLIFALRMSVASPLAAPELTFAKHRSLESYHRR